MSLEVPPPDPDQLAVLDAWSGALLVLGGPGTGKTSLVGQATVRAHRAGRRPLVWVGTRQAASVMRNSVSLSLAATTSTRILTPHAWCRELLERFDPAAERTLLTAPEQEFRVRELLTGPGAAVRWPERLRPALATRGFARQVRAALARARQWGMDPEDVIAHAHRADAPEWVAFGEFFAEYLDVMDAEASLDYAELVHRCRILLTEPTVADLVRAEIDEVIVDDLVDLDPAQIGLLRELVGGLPLLVTADPNGSVLGFRGAHPRIITDFAALFGTADGSGVPIRYLSAGRRTGTPLAEALRSFEGRVPKPSAVSIPPTTPAQHPTSVRVLRTSGEAAQATAIAAEVRRLRVAEGVEYSDMAVIVRSGRAQAPVLLRALAVAGVPVDVAADEIVLADSPAVQPLLVALEVVLAGAADPTQAELLLTGGLAGLDPVELRLLVRRWRADHPAVGTAPLTSSEVLTAVLADPDWAAEDSEPSVRSTRLARVLAQARADLAAGRPVASIVWGLWQGTDWPTRLRAEALRGGSWGRRADRDLDAVTAFFDLVAESALGDGPRGVQALLAEVAAQQIPADRERESRIGARGVQIVSAQRARGRQWQVVVVAGIQEGAWPAARSWSGLLEPTRLRSDGIGMAGDLREHLAHERRLFALACSRASKHLLLAAVDGVEGEANSPSRFLGELPIPLAAVPDPAPVHLRDLVILLRQALMDPASSAARSRAAAAVLARLGNERRGDDSVLVPWADPERWWGVREISSHALPPDAVIRLSPSQVGDVLRCPRRYFLTRRVGAGGSASAAASLGSILHLVVQYANSGGLDEVEVGRYLDAAWEHLSFDAGWLSAVERAVAEASIGRFLTWRKHRSVEAVGVEVPFTLELELDGLRVRLAGAVDRLERVGEALRVVDFKTGRSVPTKAEAERMEQLGIYQLAIEAGAFAAVAPEQVSAGAEAVYLRHAGSEDDLPKTLQQPSLATTPRHATDPDHSFDTWAAERIHRAATTIATGTYPATPGDHCRWCGFADSCPAVPGGGQVI